MSALTNLKAKIFALSQKMLAYNYKIDNGQDAYATYLSKAVEDYCEEKITEEGLVPLDYSTNIEADKASTTKVSAIKTLYDWAVAKFLLATKLVTSWSGTPSHENIPSEKLVKDSLNLKAEITTFENIVVNNWVADTTYVNFDYKADIPLIGVTATDIIEVIFGHDDAISGYYSPVNMSGDNKITIYAKVNTTITIPLIIKYKQ